MYEVEFVVEKGRCIAQGVEYKSNVKFCKQCGSTTYFYSTYVDWMEEDMQKLQENDKWSIVKMPKRHNKNL